MAQNVIVSGVRHHSDELGIHLKKIHSEGYQSKKVMDVLMDIDSAYPGKKIGRSLLEEFFPGKLRPDEEDWWNGKKDAYDKARVKANRGVPWSSRSDEDKIAA
jgi:hypothetical protein